MLQFGLLDGQGQGLGKKNIKVSPHRILTMAETMETNKPLNAQLGKLRLREGQWSNS